MAKKTGDFTLPGEAGYEKTTIELAKKWGADVIRDSDGTKLSPEILNAGYDIYSTVCVIREHNEYLNENPDKYQQTFLMSKPVLAVESSLKIDLLNGYFKEQFKVNDTEDSMKFWQVFDRTTEELVSDNQWTYDKETGCVLIENIAEYHYYTVNFFAYRIWEEISMYNHVTNNWDKEHLAPLDPRTEDAQEYLLTWMKKWCEEHADTNVVRFTSLFYNFVWMWGSDESNRNLFSDWGSYDFTVSPKALNDFEKEYGYGLCSEDFINQGKFHVTHMPAEKKQLDYMEFTQKFVAELGKKLVDIVHEYGKKAYVFYDDSWVGLEPYGKYFDSIGFDGLIKCVFSGYEARLCAGVNIKTHELRLHPYLFPVGLGGKPTFMEGGTPTKDAQEYWVNVRKALMREKIDRLGLGGYLHLTEGFPDFVDYIEELLDEFRAIKELHEKDEVYQFPVTVAVLHSWGKLRSWTLSGHFHETYMHNLIHINEALSGMPVNVKFIDFSDVTSGALEDVDVVINAGTAQSAWSGGIAWEDEHVLVVLQKWVHDGGIFIGVNEPSARDGFTHYFRMAEVLGVDKDLGAYVCHGKWSGNKNQELADKLITAGSDFGCMQNLRLQSNDVMVLSENNGNPNLTLQKFGMGYGIYMASYQCCAENNRTLLNLIMHLTGCNEDCLYIADDARVDCAYFKNANTILVANSSAEKIVTHVNTLDGKLQIELDAYEMKIIQK